MIKFFFAFDFLREQLLMHISTVTDLVVPILVRKITMPRTVDRCLELSTDSLEFFIITPDN